MWTLAHRSRWPHRKKLAVLLLTVYMSITLIPLAPLAMHSKSVAHAVTGECTGDCDTCGCSLESRASKSCCCARKNQQQTETAKLTAGDCCSKKTAFVPVVAKESCCSTSKSLTAEVVQNDCCSKAGYDDTVQEPEQSAAPAKSEVVYKCGCPCGKSKHPVMAGAGSSELLPYFYSERILLPYEDTHYSYLPHSMDSRYGEPPDPPPKLSLLS